MNSEQFVEILDRVFEKSSSERDLYYTFTVTERNLFFKNLVKELTKAGLLLQAQQPNSEPSATIAANPLLGGPKAEPLPCCPKCGMPGQTLGTRCLAEDCPGSQQGNGT